MRRFARIALSALLIAALAGCFVASFDNVGRAGSDAAVVIGWRELAGCTPSKGAANAALTSLKITMGDREIPIVGLRDVIDTEVETAPGAKTPPPLQYRVALIKIPADMPPGKTLVRIHCDGKELTDRGISPVEFEILPGKGRTAAEIKAAK